MNTILRDCAPHLVVGLAGTSLTGRERKLLAEVPPAGVIVFARNVRDAGQLGSLTAEVKGVVRDVAGITPLVMADHEGGRISVLGNAIGVPPSQMAVARTGDVALCAEVFRETAVRMKACGVDMVLAPLADINTEYLNPVIGTRSFGEDAGTVTAMVKAAVRALSGAGVISCLKHFPGHGSTVADSHLSMPGLGLTIEQLVARELVPFSGGIEAGADTIMMGHVVPHDRTRPASLDPGVIGGLIRERLGFEGVVMTDALEMEGVRLRGEEPFGGGVCRGRRERRTFLEVTAEAIAAGNDLLLFSRPMEEVYGELELLDGAWRGLGESLLGRVSSNFQASRTRVEALRGRIHEGDDAGAPEPGAPVRDMALSGAGSYTAVAERAVTVRGAGGAAPPFRQEHGMTFVFCGEREDFENTVVRRFIGRLLKGYPSARGHSRMLEAVSSGRYPRDLLRPVLSCTAPGTRRSRELLELGAEGDSRDLSKVPCLVGRRPIPAEAIGTLCSGAGAVIVCGWPYAADFIGESGPVIVTYGVYDAAADRVCRFLGHA